MHNWNWRDLQFVLAVARKGSAAAAARELGVSHATVIRHIQAFEENWPEPVFEHRRDGYRLTEKGQAFLEAAESIGSTLSELERRAIEGDSGLSGNVRVTTTDSLFPILARGLTGFHVAYPDITVDLSMTNQRLDLFDRDADIALRPSNKPPPDLLGRRVGSLEVCAYHHRPLDQNERIEDLPWIGFDHPILLSRAGEEIEAFIRDFRVVARADSFVGALRLAEAGIGCTFLPDYLGDHSPGLTRLSRELLPMSVDVWLLTHKDIVRAKRVKVCLDYLFRAIRGNFQQSGT